MSINKIKQQIKWVVENVIHPMRDQSIGAQAIRQVLGGAIVTVLDLFIFQLTIIGLAVSKILKYLK